ncbi:MAG: DUF6268 family outer membrane beta-barrel protein [Planctomycetaceae bacterium]|nr:DUF6268 family outer membrane beta-barrel protein [Planctomycetaceae bacterium]
MTPNFGYTSAQWDGPQKFPSSLYTAGLNVGWMKPVNERWTLMANVMPHWASDGQATQDAVRCPLMAGMTWTPNRQWKVMFGAIYLDRSDIAVLPFGGLVWTPNDDWRFELTAPQARISRRLNISTSEFQRWGYVGGGFGGGTWAVESVNHQSDVAMFREYSVVLGYECVKTNSYTWGAEIGYLFGRRMDFDRNTQSRFEPNDSLMLQAKFSY